MKFKLKFNNNVFATAVLIFALMLLFALSLYVTIYFINNPFQEDPEGKIRIEIIKSLLTIQSVAIIGGIVTALFNSYNRYQEKLKLRLQAKSNFMTKLGEFYRAVKSSRRKMNKYGIEASKEKPNISLNKTQIEIYKIEMVALNEIQLEVEGFKVAVEKKILFSYDKNIAASLKLMEEYLREILSEYEKNFNSLRTVEQIELEKFPYLREFTYYKAQNEILSKKNADNSYYSFKENFSRAYYNVLSKYL